MIVRAIIADDEPLARARLRRLLGNQPDVEIVAECADGAATVEAVQRLLPDVLFLDVEMPELDAFEVLAGIGSARPPAIVFVTAYDRHAIRAFEEHALDFVQKPVEAGRLARSVERVRAHIANGDLAGQLAALTREFRSVRQSLDRIAIRSRGRIGYVRTAEVTFLESAGNYVRIHTVSESHMIRETLASIESKLDPKRFVRIHRTTIVNVDSIRELRPWFGGDYIVVMNDGTELTLSRTFRERAGPLLGL
jgi:two-component system LytT family response regulator